jgi:hypothetical protein
MRARPPHRRPVAGKSKAEATDVADTVRRNRRNETQGDMTTTTCKGRTGRSTEWELQQLWLLLDGVGAATAAAGLDRELDSYSVWWNCATMMVDSDVHTNNKQ